ncbi:MAG: TM2 domain-containing protein, partial [Candidatus Scatosoma sp.]
DNEIYIFREALNNAPDEKYNSLVNVSLKSSTTTLLLSIFLGGIGVDRFYIGDTGTGICKLLFGWLTLGIWPLIDIFCCYKKTKKKNSKALFDALNG